VSTAASPGGRTRDPHGADSPVPQGPLPHEPLPVLVAAVLVVATAQQALIPVLAPLGREIGLPEVAMGVVMTVAAAMFSITSPLWGRAVDSWGQRPVLLAGLTLSLLGLLGFAVVSQLAVSGQTGGDTSTVTLMVLTRSLVFGAGMGAVPVSAMAWVAANTTTTEARVAGISRIGAVQGVAMALGPALGGMLAFAGLLGPVWAAPVLLALIWVGVAVALPRSPDRTTDPTADAGEPVVRRRGLRPWDPRLWPVMVVGFGIFLSLGMTMISLGFLVQDRLGVQGAEAVRTAGIVSTAAGVAMVLTQGFLVPRLRWAPWRLLRAGLPTAGIAVSTLVVADSLVAFSLGMAGVAFGVGLAAPGYTSSPTLLVGPEEQGSVAGLVQMVTGATFVLGPLLGSVLYGIAPGWPFVGAACLCALGTAFVWLRRSPVPADTGGATSAVR
jgi:DHA1 family tetracycline resistance protein-like MFS transporter